MTFGSFIGVLIIGLIVGLLARFITPGIINRACVLEHYVRELAGNRTGCVCGVGIRQYNDGSTLLRIDDVHADETRGSAAVSQHSPFRRHTHTQSKRVSRTNSIGEHCLGLELAIRVWFHETLIDDGDVPACQVLCRHGQLAGCEHPALPLVKSRMNGAERRAPVPGA